MAAMEPLCCLLGIDPKRFTKKERILLEADLLMLVCDELKEFFRQRYKPFFRFMKFTLTQENTMLENNLTPFIINDIISSEEYTIQGIAHYMDIHEDVIVDLSSGLNTKPLAIHQRKAIGVHRTVRRELYRGIRKKIISLYLAENKSAEEEAIY